MKTLTTLLLTLLVLGGCTQETDIKPIASIKLEGFCKDEEIPSPFKEMDEYKVQGNFRIYQSMSFGYLIPTEEEILKRNLMSMSDVPDYEYVSKDMYAVVNNFSSSAKTKYFAKSDIPRVEIYKISKEIFQSDIWNIDGYHSYVDGEGDRVEETRHYGYVKASCTLRAFSKEGAITDEFADQFDWCFNSDCRGDTIFSRED